MQSSKDEEPIWLSRKIMDSEDWNWSWGWTNSGFLIFNVQINEDRDKLFFVKNLDKDEKASLYYRDLKKKNSSWGREQGVKLASNIDHVNNKTFTISSSGKTVLYIKNYDAESGGQFYLHNLTSEQLIDHQVTDYWYSDDKNLIYYTKVNEEEREEDLYYVHVKKLKDKEQAASNIHSVLQLDEEKGDLYYTTTILDEPNNNLKLFKQSPGKKAVELASGIGNIVSFVEDDSFYYTESVITEVKLSDLVEDDLAESDGAIQKPSIADYTTIEENVEHVNWWTGETYYRDVEHTDYDSYNEAKDRYSAKAERDRLRRALSKEMYQQESLHLYYSSKGKSKKLVENYDYPTYVDAADGTIVYYKKSLDKEKVLLSEIKRVDDVRSAYEERDPTSPAYISNKHVVDLNFGEDGKRLMVLNFSSDGKVLYGREMGGNTDADEIVTYDIVKGKPENRKVLVEDEDVLFANYLPESSQLFYYKGTDIYNGDLFVIENGKSKQIAENVGMWQSRFYFEDKSLFYYTDYDDDKNVGTLHQYKDGKSKEIASGVSSFYYSKSAGLYYIADYNYQRRLGTLMKAEDKGESIFIADEVSEIFDPERFNWLGL